MGRRRRFTRQKGAPTNTGGGSRPRELKLNIGGLSSFEYRLKNILEDVEAGGTIFGNICSKANNLGIAEAKKYVEVLADDGDIEREKSGEILELLNTFSTLR